MLRRCLRWWRWCTSYMGSASRCGRYRKRWPRKVTSRAEAGRIRRRRSRKCFGVDKESRALPPAGSATGRAASSRSVCAIFAVAVPYQHRPVIRGQCMIYRYVLPRRWHEHDLADDLFDRVAVGAAMFKDLGRLAVEPIAQFLDGLHVAGLTARDVDLCDLA